jgi:hypothetical protein
MALFTFLLRRSIASTRRKKASPLKKKPAKRPILKGKPSSRKLYPIPVQKKKGLSECGRRGMVANCRRFHAGSQKNAIPL